ncbi:TetR family transcriptional regulator [Streptomonospora halophila]|uniref:TetR family transcriptional regulator n=1 Tax=Streptomonospora halophila TaxID=427369 RepID=A0ABP9G9E1_9ACTN
MAAGLDLLAEGGWPAITARAVAERSGANTGLIHYHFGGLAGLRRDVARAGTEQVLEPFAEALLERGSVGEVLDELARIIPASTDDDRAMRIAVELVVGAQREPDLCDVLRDELREARGRIADRVAALYPHWGPRRCTGAAVLVTALLDGLVLHVMADREVPVGAASEALRDLLEGAD